MRSPELDAVRRPVDRLRQQPLHGPGAASPDVDAFLDEPLVGEVVGLADAAEDRRGRHADVGQDELRVAVGEGVHVRRVVGEGDARRVVVDEEQRWPALLAIDHVAVEDHEIGVGRAGHEPFLAVEDVVARRAVVHGGRFERASIRPGAGLGDGVAAVALAAQARFEVAAPLVGVAMDQRVVAARDEAPEAARHLAELLVDQDLLEQRPALAADLLREAAAVEAGVDGLRLDVSGDVGVEAAAGGLEPDLERLEDLAREPPRSILERELVRAQRQVHRGQDGARGGTAPPRCSRARDAGKGRGPVGDRPSVSPAGYPAGRTSQNLMPSRYLLSPPPLRPSDRRKCPA